jgi:CRP-like cAMP-binding protein
MKVCGAASRLFPSYRPAADLDPKWSTTPARRTVVHSNALDDAVPFICSGWSVRIAVGSPQILEVLLPGEIVSPISAFGATTHWMVQAVTDVVCAFFNRGALHRFLHTVPDAGRAITAVLLERSRRSDRLIGSLARETAEQRIARLIVDIVADLDVREMALVSGQKYPFPLRQRQIGDALGLSHVHVNKVLRGFREQGLMSIHDRTISIDDLSGLQRIAISGI